MFDCIFASEIVPISQLNIYFMQVSFEQLKYLVTVVCDDLMNDDFGHLQTDQCGLVAVETEESYEIYDKIFLLKDLLDELYKYRPLPF